MKHSETDLRTRKLIAIVVTVSNNPPDARAKKYENCQGERPPSRVLMKQTSDHELEAIEHDWGWWGRPNQQAPERRLADLRRSGLQTWPPALPMSEEFSDD